MTMRVAYSVRFVQLQLTCDVIIAFSDLNGIQRSFLVWQGVLAKSASNVVIAFLNPSFPSRDYTPCCGPGVGSVLFEPLTSQVRSSYGCTAVSP